MAPQDPVRMSKELEDEINPPLSSALVTEPQAVREEIRAEDEEISHMQLAHDLEKNGDSDVVDSVASEEPTQPKITVFDFPDGGRKAWIMVFGAWYGLTTCLLLTLTGGFPFAHSASSILSVFLRIITQHINLQIAHLQILHG
jgi:hypothetical protein